MGRCSARCWLGRAHGLRWAEVIRKFFVIIFPGAILMHIFDEFE